MRCDATRDHRDDLRGGGAPVFAGRFRTDGCTPPRAAVTHAYAALAFHVGGTSRVEQRERWTLTDGDVMLVPAGEPHRTLEARGAEMWGVGFCVACVAAEPGAAHLLEPFERVRDGGAAVVRLPAGRRPHFEALCGELTAACARVDAGAAAVQRSLLTLILDEVARAAGGDPAERRPTLVGECLRVIERRCLGPLTLADLAAAVRRSPAHVTTALRRSTGRTAHEWIVAGRMAEARRRLLHSDERVDIIAERVGYADPTNFIRMFRRHHGATPAAWRQQHQGEPG
jgi:AraC-like DNA-binding protein